MPIVESSEEELVIDVECPELSLHNVVLDNEGYSKDRIDSNEYEAQPVSGSGKDDVKKKKNDKKWTRIKSSKYLIPNKNIYLGQHF